MAIKIPEDPTVPGLSDTDNLGRSSTETMEPGTQRDHEQEMDMGTTEELIS